jgi:hypothetical protein
MAENDSVPASGAVPPKPAEAAKVQPKKETVRINLPPKPTAAPTIKIPAPAAPMAAKPVGGAPPPPAGAPAAAAAGTPAPPPARPVAAAPAMRPSAPRAAAPPAISGLDKALAVAAALIGVLALVRVFLLG